MAITQPHPVTRGPRDRRRGGWRRRVRLIALVTVAALVVLTLVLWFRLAAFNDRVSNASTMSTSLFGPLNGTDPVNLLILGYGGPGHDGPFLTDSINVLSIDPSTDHSTIIPIPRDLWIEGHPDVPNNGKINQAFSIGHGAGGVAAGAESASRVVAAVTSLELHHWITMDFEGLVAAVEAVGGVVVDNPSAFSYGSPEDVATRSGWDGTFEAGEIHLDGEAALFYARTRYTSDPAESNDFARSIRQQRVLKGLVDKVVGGGLGSIPSALAVMDAVSPHLRTDLSAIDLALVAPHMSPDRRIELTEGAVLEATTTTDGQYVLVPVGRASPDDYRPIEAYITERLAEPIPSASPESGG